jgi:surface antigen
VNQFHKIAKIFRSIFYSIEHFLISILKKYNFFGIGKFIRSNGSFAIIIVIALFVSFSNLSAKSNNEAFLVGYWQEEKHKILNQVNVSNKESGLVLDGSDLSEKSATIILTEDKKNKEEIFQTDIQILAEDNESLFGGDLNSLPQRRAGSGDLSSDDDVQTYTVLSGDTVSQIAKKFGVTVNTILWANEVEYVNEIKPGDTLFILPTSGVTHKVKSGETLDKIAKKYKAEESEIIAFNDLPANGEIKKGQELVIPGGEKEKPQALFARRDYNSGAVGSSGITTTAIKTSSKKRVSGNKFPYGYCTYYVAQRKNVTWRGNAGAWLYNAKAQGYATGKKPKVGSIVVTTEDPRYGHVAYVESVGKGTITVSEMNYKGWGVVNRRTLSQSSPVIKGYVY